MVAKCLKTDFQADIWLKMAIVPFPIGISVLATRTEHPKNNTELVKQDMPATLQPMTAYVAPGLQEETLERAADLFMLRRDTFRIIDGAGPSVDNQGASSERSAQADLIDEGKASQAPAPKPEQASEHKEVESQKQPATQPKCTFHGEVPIDLRQFSESGVDLVECPDCTSTSALSPHKGTLHFCDLTTDLSLPVTHKLSSSADCQKEWPRVPKGWPLLCIASKLACGAESAEEHGKSLALCSLRLHEQ